MLSNKQELVVLFLWAMVGFLAYLLNLKIMFLVDYTDLYSFVMIYFGGVFSKKIILYTSAYFIDVAFIFIGAFVLGIFFRLKLTRLLSFYVAKCAVGIFALIESLYFYWLQSSSYFLEFIEIFLGVLCIYAFMFFFAWVACLSGRKIGFLMFGRNECGSECELDEKSR